MEKLFEKPKVMIFEANDFGAYDEGSVIPLIAKVYGFFIEKRNGVFETFYLDEMYRVIAPKRLEAPCGKLTPILKYEEGEKIGYKEFSWICNRRLKNSISTIDDEGEIEYMDRRDDIITYNSLTESGLVIEKFPDEKSIVYIDIDEDKDDYRRQFGNCYMVKLRIRIKLDSVGDMNYVVINRTHQNYDKNRIKSDYEIKTLSCMIDAEISRMRKIFNNQNISLSLKKGDITVYSTLTNKSIMYVKDKIMELVEL